MSSLFNFPPSIFIILWKSWTIISNCLLGVMIGSPTFAFSITILSACLCERCNGSSAQSLNHRSTIGVPHFGRLHLFCSTEFRVFFFLMAILLEIINMNRCPYYLRSIWFVWWSHLRSWTSWTLSIPRLLPGLFSID